MATYYSIEEMFDIYQNNVTNRYDEAIRNDASIMRLYFEKAPITQYRSGKMQLSISKASSFILSSVIESAGYIADPKRFVMTKINIITQVNFDSTFRELRNRDINPQFVLDSLLQKATSPIQDPESPNSGIPIQIQLFLRLREVNEKYNEFPGLLLKAYDQNISLAIQNKCKTILVYLSYFFVYNILKRKQYGEILIKIINGLRVEAAVEHLISALSISARRIDTEQYTEFTYFYRFIMRNLNSCSGFTSFKVTEHFEQRAKGWPDENPIIKEKRAEPKKFIMNSTSSKIYTGHTDFNFNCGDAIEQMYEEWKNSSKFMDILNFKPDIIVETAFKLFERHVKDVEDYSYFIAFVLDNLFKKKPVERYLAFKKHVHIFQELTKSEEGTKIYWDGFGRMLDTLYIHKKIEQQHLFDILSIEDIPLPQSVRIKCIIEKDDVVSEYESTKIFKLANGGIPKLDKLNMVFVNIALYSEFDTKEFLINPKCIEGVQNMDPHFVFKFIRAAVFESIQDFPRLRQYQDILFHIKQKWTSLFKPMIEKSIELSSCGSTKKQNFRDLVERIFYSPMR